MISFISINVPGIADQVNRILLGLAQLDILPARALESWLLHFDDIDDYALTDKFNELGYSNINSLRNMGSSFLYFVIALACMIVVASASIVVNFFFK